MAQPKKEDDYVTLYADVTKLTPKAVRVTRDDHSVWFPLRYCKDLKQVRIGATRIDVARWIAAERGVLSS